MSTYEIHVYAQGRQHIVPNASGEMTLVSLCPIIQVDTATVKFVVGGNILDSNQTLSDAGVHEGGSVECHLTTLLCTHCAAINKATLADQQCINCGDILCTVHLQLHRRRYADHRIVQGPVILPCRQHEEFYDTFFCYKTDQFVCRECLSTPAHEGCVGGRHVPVSDCIDELVRDNKMFVDRTSRQCQRLAASCPPVITDADELVAVQHGQAAVDRVITATRDALEAVASTLKTDIAGEVASSAALVRARRQSLQTIELLVHQQQDMTEKGCLEASYRLRQEVVQRLADVAAEEDVTFSAPQLRVPDASALRSLFAPYPPTCGKFKINEDGIASVDVPAHLDAIRRLVETCPNITGIVCPLGDDRLDDVLTTLGTIGQGITTLGLHDCPLWESRHIVTIAETFPQLTELDISCGCRIEPVSEESVTVLANHCGSRLKKLGVGGSIFPARSIASIPASFPHLVALDISGTGDLGGLTVDTLLGQLNLTTLNVSHTDIRANTCSSPCLLETLYMAKCTFRLANVPQRLKTLAFGRSEILSAKDLPLMHKPNIRELELYKSALPSQDCFAPMRHLRDLTLYKVQLAPWFAASVNRTLKHLSMHDCNGLGSVFKRIARSFVGLVSLTLSPDMLDAMKVDLDLRVCNTDVDPMALLRLYRRKHGIVVVSENPTCGVVVNDNQPRQDPPAPAPEAAAHQAQDDDDVVYLGRRRPRDDDSDSDDEPPRRRVAPL